MKFNPKKGNITAAVILISLVAAAASIGAGYFTYKSYYQLKQTTDKIGILQENKNISEEIKNKLTQESDTENDNNPAINNEFDLSSEFDNYLIAATSSTAAADAINRFAFELYNQYKDADDNVFFSPYSISSALGMVYEGAKNQTSREIQSVFHFSEDNQTRLGSFANLYEQINSTSTAYQLSAANALWAQNNYPFSQNYLKIIGTYYYGNAANLDFAKDAENARQTINKWVSQKTAEKIPELFAANSLDPQTRLVLTNAVYFKSDWLNQFNKENMREKEFLAASGEKTACQMMFQRNNFNYFENEDFQALELPYKNNELSMIVILPRSEKINVVENNLDIQKFAEIKQSLRPESVILSLPKFKFETSYNMNDPLAKMGMPTAFDPYLADFSGITGNRDLFLSLVVHKAYINTDESGTEAAAATGAVAVPTSVQKELTAKIFNANHPFIFAIVHNKTNTILFLGKINNPAE